MFTIGGQRSEKAKSEWDCRLADSDGAVFAGRGVQQRADRYRNTAPYIKSHGQRNPNADGYRDSDKHARSNRHTRDRLEPRGGPAGDHIAASLTHGRRAGQRDD